MTRALLVTAALLLAISTPVAAFLLYPGKPPLLGVNGEKPLHRHEPVFVEALRHSHYYRGVHAVAGFVEEATPRGFVLDTLRGKVLVVLPPCLLIGGKAVPGHLVAENLVGSHVIVYGHVFRVHGIVVVKPLKLLVHGHVLLVKPCPGLRNHTHLPLHG